MYPQMGPDYSTTRLPGYGICGHLDCKTWGFRCNRGRCRNHHYSSCEMSAHSIPTEWVTSDGQNWCNCKGKITGPAVHQVGYCHAKEPEPLFKEGDKLLEPSFGRVEEEHALQTMTHRYKVSDDHWFKVKGGKQ